MTLLGKFFKFAFSSMIVTALISGCGSTGLPYRDHRAIAPDTVQIVVFRPDSLFQGGIPYQVNLNGKGTTILRNGGFTVINTEPGTILLEIRSANWIQTLFRNPSLSLQTKATDRIFVRVTPRTGNTVTLDVVPITNAALELKALKESQ